MKNSRLNSKPQAAPWIYNPWLDLIVGCGAWSAPLLLLSYLSLASEARTWSVVFYVLALFFNYPHYMATIYRAYHRSEDFQKYRIFTVHTTALLVMTLLLSHYLAAAAALDLHHLFDLEPVALQRTELRAVHDVRAPGGRGPGQSYSPCVIWRVRSFVSDSVSRISYRAVDRSAVSVARDSARDKPLGADYSGRGVRGTLGLWTVAISRARPDGES